MNENTENCAVSILIAQLNKYIYTRYDMLGFACICKSLTENGCFKSTTVKYISKLSREEQLKKLRAIAVDNLYNTYKILEWCKTNNIFMYRMSSDLIPLATYFKEWEWWNDPDILKQCSNIKAAAHDNSIRLSMHPDQFCVLNSHKQEVVASSVEILEYHNRLSNLTGNKLLVLHAGSSADGKRKASERFIHNFLKLDEDIRSKLALENDDKIYNAADILSICEKLGIPMVLDLHHHRCNNNGEDLYSLRTRIIKTWNGNRPKLHLSTGKEFRTDRRHADFISEEDYKLALDFAGSDFDIMLECKEKDIALLKLRSLKASDYSQ
ncbi:MAG: UV DNA damage repair endonuclease UvsE [Bacillota bacterium]